MNRDRGWWPHFYCSLGPIRWRTGRSFVDVERVFDESRMGYLARRTLTDQFVERESSLRRRMEALAVVRAGLEQGQLPAGLLEAAMRHLIDAEQRLSLDSKLLKAEEAHLTVECHDEMFRRVRIAVEKLATAMNADFILDSVLYVRPEADWTSKVIWELDNDLILSSTVCGSKDGPSEKVSATLRQPL
ncbi:OmpH family outer membrane protein [Variovorax sp. GT1P44]|uniref:OmpH family outer membrane protein n=1 Tax=Variovorax sp. GT1P44 TaxID=3443742 RepID=UPI003F471116